MSAAGWHWRWFLIGLLALVVVTLQPMGAFAGAAGTVTVIKRDSITLEPVGGACFRILNSGQTQIANVCDGGPSDVSSDPGVIIYDTATPGLYYVQEKQAPPGYSIDDTSMRPCDATGDLLCVVELSDTPAGVGGIAELARAEPLEAEAPQGNPGVSRWGWAAVVVGTFFLTAASQFVRHTR